MKAYIVSLGCVIWLLSASLTSQEVYKTITEEGKVVFSDTPQQNSKKIETELTNLQTPAQVRPKQHTRNTSDSTTYKVRLTSPKDGYQLGPSQRALSLSITITPKLEVGDKVEFWLDGKRVRGPSKSTSASYPMGIKMRGRHTVSAKIVNANGSTVASSATSTIHVIRPN